MSQPIDSRPSPHCRPRTKAVSAIVVHYSGSLDLDRTVAWMQRPETGYSAHYAIGRTGRVVQMVAEDHVAFHAGRSALYPAKANDAKEPHVDEFSIGVELIGTADSGFTDQQLAALYALVERLIHAYRIPPSRIVGHQHIAPGRKIDPDGFDRQFPWARLIEIARIAYQALQDKQLTPLSATRSLLE